MGKLGGLKQTGKKLGTTLGKVGGKVADAGKKGADKAKKGINKSIDKLDDLAGVVDGKVDKHGKVISKNKQRLDKLGDAAEGAMDAYDAAVAVKDMISPGETINTDGGGGNPTGAARPEPEPAPKEPEKDEIEKVSKPMMDKAKDGVQQAAQNVLNEQNGATAGPSRSEYLQALDLVNKYESEGCKRNSNKKPNPVGPQKMQF